MNNLDKMKESCIEFAADLKTGNVEWNKNTCFEFMFNVEIGEHSIGFILESSANGLDGEFVLCTSYDNIPLQSETAKEAAIEALQLVKNEAQKLVDALSEPKDETPKLDAFREYIQRLSDLTKFAPINTKHNDTLVQGYKYALKIAEEAYKEFENKECPWIKIDHNNLPKMEVFATNGNHSIGGFLGKTIKGNVFCDSNFDRMFNPTHYLEYETILKLIPKPTNEKAKE